MGERRRWGGAVARTAAVVAVLMVAFGEARFAAAHAGGSTGGAPATLGRWSAPFDLHVIGTHQVLLPGGRVLAFSYPAPADRGADTWTWDSTSGEILHVPSPLRRDVFCAGHSLLPDGRAFVTGGTMWGSRAYDGARDTSF